MESISDQKAYKETPLEKDKKITKRRQIALFKDFSLYALFYDSVFYDINPFH